MTITVDSAGRERVEALWQSLVEFHTQSGGEIDELKQRVNVGYVTSYSLYPTERRNIEEKVEAPEIVSFCYSDEKYYHLLHKHGFPVPMAMNDFNEATKADETWRQKTCREIDSIKKKFEAEDNAPRKGTDLYRRELARRIDAYLASIADWGKIDCKQEVVDWQALEQRCGGCTEKSEIWYFAYRHAGLNPTFMILEESEPTVERMELAIRAAAETGLPGTVNIHALVGIPMEDGSFLQVDPHGGKFDAGWKYAYAVSPRQFSVSVVDNIINTSDESDGPRLRNLQLDLAPDDPFVFLRNRAGKVEAKDFNPTFVKALIDDLYKHFGETRLTEFYVQLLLLLGLQSSSNIPPDKERHYIQNAMSMLDLKIKVLCATDPRTGAMELFRLGWSKFEAAKALGDSGKKDEGHRQMIEELTEGALNLVKSSLFYNPYYYPAVSFVHDLARLHYNSVGIVNLYEELAHKFPKHSYFRFRLVEACLKAAEESGDRSYLYKGFEHARILAERLEPENPKTNYLLGRYALLLSKPKLARDSLEKARRLLPNLMPEVPETNIKEIDIGIMAAMIIAGLQDGDEDYFNSTLSSVIQRYPDAWASEMFSTLENLSPTIYFGPDGKFVGPAEIERRADMILSVFERIERILGNRGKLDTLYINGAIITLGSSGGNAILADKFISRVSDINDDAVQKFFKKCFEDQIISSLSVKQFMGGKGSLPKAYAVLKYFDKYLKGDYRLSLALGYAHLARHALSYDDTEIASDALERALSIDSKGGADKYFDVVVSEFYSLCQENRPDSDKKKMCDTSLEAATLLWLRRKEVPISTLKRMSQMYDLIANEFIKLGQADRAKFARDRAKAIKNEIDRK